jgi:hypothetical protein
LTGFLRRHPNISRRVSQCLPKQRALVTEAQIRGWFREVRLYLTIPDMSAAMMDPRRVFNGDEGAFFLSPNGEWVFVGKGQKNTHQVVPNSTQENYTVLITANALGELPPPMVVFSYSRRIPPEIMKTYPKGWGIGKSQKGWMNSELFFEYITNIFHPWIVQNNIPKPVIFFLDGHSSHATLHLSKFCKANGIVLVSLLPNSTHILQPLDVSFFHPCKTVWKSELRDWRMNHHGLKIGKPEFAPLLEKVIKKAAKPETFINGFRACGLFPFSEDAINYSKIPTGTVNTSFIENFEPAPKPSINQTHLTFIESKLHVSQIANFEIFQFSTWEGPECDKSLFELWKNLKKECSSTLAASDDTGTASCLQQTTETISILPSIVSDNLVVIQINHEEPSTSTNIENSEHNQHNQESESDLQHPTETNPAENSVQMQIDQEQPSTSAMTFSTPTKQNIPNTIKNSSIPSPFKNSLFWPVPTTVNTRKRKFREKVPAVTTSDQWIAYEEKRIKIIADEQENKQKRKENRELQKLIKQEVTKKKKEDAAAKKAKPKTEKKKVEKKNLKKVVLKTNN